MADDGDVEVVVAVDFKHQVLAVGAPIGVALELRPRGQLAQLAGIQVEHVQVPEALPPRGKGQVQAVGADGRVAVVPRAGGQAHQVGAAQHLRPQVGIAGGAVGIVQGAAQRERVRRGRDGGSGRLGSHVNIDRADLLHDLRIGRQHRRDSRHGHRRRWIGDERHHLRQFRPEHAFDEQGGRGHQANVNQDEQHDGGELPRGKRNADERSGAGRARGRGAGGHNGSPWALPPACGPAHRLPDF